MNEDKEEPKVIAKRIAKQLNVKRFLVVGETNAENGQRKALIMCWNGKEFQNQIDLVGLYALGARAIIFDKKISGEK